MAGCVQVKQRTRSYHPGTHSAGRSVTIAQHSKEVPMAVRSILVLALASASLTACATGPSLPPTEVLRYHLRRADRPWHDRRPAADRRWPGQHRVQDLRRRGAGPATPGGLQRPRTRREAAPDRNRRLHAYHAGRATQAVADQHRHRWRRLQRRWSSRRWWWRRARWRGRLPDRRRREHRDSRLRAVGDDQAQRPTSRPSGKVARSRLLMRARPTRRPIFRPGSSRVRCSWGSPVSPVALSR